ncbi:MAG: glycosyltransferase family 1 protein [Terracidiphilus sp.]
MKQISLPEAPAGTTGGANAMRIVVAAVSSNHSMSGVSRHAANLVRGLLTKTEVSALHLLVAPWEHEYVCESISRLDIRLHVHAVQLLPGILHRNLWYYRILPDIAEQLRADVVHFAYPSPIKRGAFPCPTVVTLHDLYPYDIPSNFGFPKVLFNRMILRQCLRNVSAIACVSDSTRLQLGLRLPEAMPKAVTVSNCVEEGPLPVEPPFVASWGNDPFLLCVAQHRRNKNVLTALRSFNRALKGGEIHSETRLVIVGMPGPETARIHGFVRSAHLTHRVAFASGISDAELHWCYRNCQLLLAPSTVEGFGLPVVEAQLAGCRIVCSDIPAFREVDSGTCHFVELETEEAEELFARAIVSSLCDRRPFPAHLPHLLPAHVAEQYTRLYGRILASSRGSMKMISAAKEGPVRSRDNPSVADKVPTAARY